MKTLFAQANPLANHSVQKDILRAGSPRFRIQNFEEKLRQMGVTPLRSRGVEILQVNLGKKCNQTCSHCHVDAGPDRKEEMSTENISRCLDILSKSDILTLDITGGAPELHPEFRRLVTGAYSLGKKMIVRCNLTILLAGERFQDLPHFYANRGMEVISSLPCYTQENTDRQRGKGVFEKSIEAIRRLNTVGYGVTDSGLELNLVFNPGGASLPGNQTELEADYKRELWENYGIVFNKLFTITNIPVNRFLDSLLKSGKYESYMEKLVNAFNPVAAEGVMCRNMLSVSWDGKFYDCDFNQMLELPIKGPKQLSDFDEDILVGREIVTGNHCYGCTAGQGSSCGGAVV